MPDDNGGYVRIYRSILDNPTFRDIGEAMFFTFLVLKANWRGGERRYDERVYKLERGDLVLGERKLAEGFGWTRQKVRGVISRLEATGMLTRKWAQHGDQRAPVITICNYSLYQDMKKTPNQGANQAQPKVGPPKKEGKERKESKEPTSGTILSFPSSDHHHTGGPKENDRTRDGSSEDLFWALADRAAAVNITRGLMGKLAGAMGDFDKAYPALLGALDKKSPPAYVAAIIKNEKQEQNLRDAAAGGRDSGEPGFVLEAYRAGQAVERLEGNTWRIAGTIYDAAGQEVGW